MTVTFERLDGRDIVHVERLLTHTVDKVWQFLVSPSKLQTWFPSQVDIDLRLGGSIRFFGDSNQAGDLTGTIVELDPPNVIAYHWGGDLLRWQVRPMPNGSLLILDQTVADRPAAASYAGGWTICVNRMIDRLAGGNGSDVRGNWAELHETYVTAFGLDRGSVTGAGTNWTARLDRQLTVPAGRALKLLAAEQFTHSLAGADIKPGDGGGRLVVEQSSLHSQEAAAEVLRNWEESVRQFADALVVVDTY